MLPLIEFQIFSLVALDKRRWSVESDKDEGKAPMDLIRGQEVRRPNLLRQLGTIEGRMMPDCSCRPQIYKPEIPLQRGR